MSASDAAIDDLPKEEPQTPPLSQSNGENGSQDAAPKKRGPKGMTEAEKEEARRKRKEAAQEEEEDSGVHAQRVAKLKFLLQRSSVYSQIMGEKMDRERKERAARAARKAAKLEAKETAEVDGKEGDGGKIRKGIAKGIVPGRSTRAGEAGAKEAKENAAAPSGRGTRSSGQKRKNDEEYDLGTYLGETDLSAVTEASESARKKAKSDAPVANGASSAANGRPDSPKHREQPALVTGAHMRDYQLDGLEWLVSLYENGLNGILADEMGLGKTLQTISFLAHLRGKGVWGPFLIVAPLSTINNWVAEFERFTPDIPALMYHGSGPERRVMREEHLRLPTIQSERNLFPVVVTSYEVVINDRKFLANLPWKFIVVDEGHRLKNLDCKLIRELKTYKSANRLILTGTPLHNNIAELWSLLNFILPDIFDDLATFEKWFDFSDIHEESGSDRILSAETSSSIITQLHEILKPFLLRRLKVDVETNLPPKKEYLLYAPLTEQQKELYDVVVAGDIRNWLIERKSGLSRQEIDAVQNGDDSSQASSPGPSRTQSPAPLTPRNKALPNGNGPFVPRTNGAKGKGTESTDDGSFVPQKRAAKGKGNESTDSSPAVTPRRGSARKTKKSTLYDNEESDDKYFERLEDESNQRPDSGPLNAKEADRLGKVYQIKEALKAVNNMHLENMVVQLRKICCHPFLFDWPLDKESGTTVVNEDLIHASGKMLLLNRLLDALFAKGHKVLIFSQFTTMLDIIEDWANEYKGLRVCRIDGTTKQEDRRSQMKSFNEDKGPDACNLFLLSTRAGGLGINLVAADTVIFYDSDWNPQMDLQAQDRVHRIGQTRPVLIFRLVSANTVEQKILKRAGNKRKLEALVIQQGKFKLPASAAASALGKGRAKQESVAEMATNLLKLEGERVQLAGKDDEIISDANLAKLLDRSPAAYARRTGWVSSHKGEEGEVGSDESAGERMAFEVTETAVDETNDSIARLMGR